MTMNVISHPSATAEGRAERDQEGRILVCGSESLTDRKLVETKLDEVRLRLGRIRMRVLTQGTRGAGTLAADWAADRGIACDEYEANDGRDGRQAEHQRDKRILAEGKPHLCVAFPRNDDERTHRMMATAEAAGILVEEIDVRTRTTLTETGQLYDVAGIVRHAELHGPDRDTGDSQSEVAGREVRILVTGPHQNHEPEMIREKLDQVRHRIGTSPMRLITTDSRGAERTAVQWAEEHGIVCNVHRRDRNGDETQPTLSGYDRDERLLAQEKPDCVIVFSRRGDYGGKNLLHLAHEDGVPYELVNEHGETISTANLELIGRLSRFRTNTPPEDPEPRPEPAQGASSQSQAWTEERTSPGR